MDNEELAHKIITTCRNLAGYKNQYGRQDHIEIYVKETEIDGDIIYSHDYEYSEIKIHHKKTISVIIYKTNYMNKNTLKYVGLEQDFDWLEFILKHE